MRITVFFILLISLGYSAKSQVPKISQLLNLAIDSSAKIVSFRPSHETLNIKDTLEYKFFLQEDKVNLDFKIILQLIENSQKLDTAYWQQRELAGFILINDPNDSINLKTVINSLNLKSKDEISVYKTFVDKFNKKHPYTRSAFRLSHPVFDKSKKYAVISYASGRNLSGGGGIRLYRFDGKKWNFISLLSIWRS